MATMTTTASQAPTQRDGGERPSRTVAPAVDIYETDQAYVLLADMPGVGRDGLDVVAEAGATAVIHPGGSIRDDEVVAAADGHGMAMVLTGIRHFKH